MMYEIIVDILFIKYFINLLVLYTFIFTSNVALNVVKLSCIFQWMLHVEMMVLLLYFSVNVVFIDTLQTVEITAFRKERRM